MLCMRISDSAHAYFILVASCKAKGRLQQGFEHEILLALPIVNSAHNYTIQMYRQLPFSETLLLKLKHMDSSRTGNCFISVHVLVFAVAMCTCVLGGNMIMSA